MFHTTSLHSILKEADAAAEAASARSAARAAETQTTLVRHDVERLLMVTEALWGILKEKFGYADEELYRRVTEIDLRDGHADGRVAPTPCADCPHCGRKLAKHHPVCLYCGKPVLFDVFQR